jgi:hypothetical protein
MYIKRLLVGIFIPVIAYGGLFDTQTLRITNTTRYYVTFRIVTAIDCGSNDPITLAPQGKDGYKYEHTGNPCKTGFHIDVGFSWSDNKDSSRSNDVWSQRMKNKDKTTRSWGFSYKDTGADDLEFRMNSDYNAPVLWNTQDEAPDGSKGWWVYQRS